MPLKQAFENTEDKALSGAIIFFRVFIILVLLWSIAISAVSLRESTDPNVSQTYLSNIEIFSSITIAIACAGLLFYFYQIGILFRSCKDDKKKEDSKLEFKEIRTGWPGDTGPSASTDFSLNSPSNSNPSIPGVSGPGSGEMMGPAAR